jgi:hypothetical protein
VNQYISHIATKKRTDHPVKIMLESIHELDESYKKEGFSRQPEDLYKGLPRDIQDIWINRILTPKNNQLMQQFAGMRNANKEVNVSNAFDKEVGLTKLAGFKATEKLKQHPDVVKYLYGEENYEKAMDRTYRARGPYLTKQFNAFVLQGHTL